MILRPLEPDPPLKPGELMSAWKVVERLQRRTYQSCWMITQPSHAALAGEIAAKLKGGAVPQLEPEVIRAIALHDAGWGMPDAQAVMHSRAASQTAPKSFLQVTVPEFLSAWTQSIEVALSTSPAGGYIVSRHFWRLAEHRLSSTADSQRDRSGLQKFVKFESSRQARLVAKQDRTGQELEVLADVLQFCDLLSLYLCSGATDNVEFAEYFGTRMRLTSSDQDIRLEPGVIESGARFHVAALRHPSTKQQSGQEIAFSFL
jgi:hypothetical protein